MSVDFVFGILLFSVFVCLVQLSIIINLKKSNLKWVNVSKRQNDGLRNCKINIEKLMMVNKQQEALIRARGAYSGATLHGDALINASHEDKMKVFLKGLDNNENHSGEVIPINRGDVYKDLYNILSNFSGDSPEYKYAVQRLEDEVLSKLDNTGHYTIGDIHLIHMPDNPNNPYYMSYGDESYRIEVGEDDLLITLLNRKICSIE